MDKLVFDGRKVTISNDGATIMALLEIAHPAAKTLVDISMSQDAEVGDGTTSVVLLAAEMLKQVKEFVEAGGKGRGAKDGTLERSDSSTPPTTISNSLLLFASLLTYPAAHRSPPPSPHPLHAPVCQARR